MKARAYLTSLLLAATLTLSAQQNIGANASTVVSPQVNADNTVTFRVKAPKATEVVVAGDWEADNGRGILSKTSDDVWEYTTPPLPSDLYYYRFIIDGVAGIDPVNPFLKRDVGNIFSLFYVYGDPANYYRVNDVPHGSVTTTWYYSEAAGEDRRMTVYTPPYYNRDRNKTYPVLYLLHGSGGDELAWQEQGNVANIMDNLIAEGKAVPMLVVMPNGNIAKQAAPGFTKENFDYKPVLSNMIPDNFKNEKYELGFGEIIDFVEANYRAIPQKSARAVAGLSMGGFHTLMISANHPDKFDYIGLFSAGLNFSNANLELPAYNNLDGKLLKLKASGYKLYEIYCGNADFLYDANKEFLARLDGLNFRYDYHESTRGHIWSNWRKYLVDFAPRLFK